MNARALFWTKVRISQLFNRLLALDLNLFDLKMKTVSQLALICILVSLLSCTNVGRTYRHSNGSRLILKKDGVARKSGGPSLLAYIDRAYYGTWTSTSENTAKVVYTSYGDWNLTEPERSLKRSFTQYYHLNHAAKTFRHAESSRGKRPTDNHEN